MGMHGVAGKDKDKKRSCVYSQADGFSFACQPENERSLFADV